MNKKALLLGVALVLGFMVLPAFGNIESLTGDLVEITFMDLGPDVSLEMDKKESNSEVFILQEHDGLTVIEPIEVDHLLPFDPDDEDEEEELAFNTGFFSHFDDLTEGTIGFDTDIDSYILHFDTINNEQVRLTGAVRFDENILALIVNETSLELTDGVLGHPFVQYQEETLLLGEDDEELESERSRGLELNGPDDDWFVITADRRTFVFSFLAKNKFDEIRIITEHAADGDDLNTNCMGFSDVEFDIIPGNRDNNITVGSTGSITTALFSRYNFDATTCLNEDTITFGPTGDEDSLADDGCSIVDFNQDGFDDLLCDFHAEEADFQLGDTEGIFRANLAQLNIEHLQNPEPEDPEFRLEYRDAVNVVEMNGQIANAITSTSVIAQQIGQNIFFNVQAASAAETLNIEIYDTQGARLFERAGAVGNVLRWNLQSSTGERLANGVYFYVVTALNGDKLVGRAIGKIAVIR